MFFYHQDVPGDNPRSHNMWIGLDGNVMLNSDIAMAFQIDETSTGSCNRCGVLDQHCGPLLSITRPSEREFIAFDENDATTLHGCIDPPVEVTGGGFFELVRTREK